MNNYTNPVTVTGNPASFEASGNGKFLSLSVPFSPIQDLHGYDSPWPAGGGANKWDEDWEVGGISSSNGQNVSQNNIRSKGYIPVSAGAEYYVFVTTDTNKKAYIFYYDSNKGYVGSSGAYVRGVLTIPSGTAFIRFQCNSNYGYSGYGNDIAINYPATVTTYSPYSNICPISGRTGLSVYVSPTQDPDDATTYAVDWTDEAGTVYGGTLDVVTGVLTVDRAYIASYNGETINEPWLSSMDAYAAGTTPTTGAQVVYKLATPLTYQLTPTQVELLIGQNNVWSDSNEAVTLTYVIELFTRYTFIVNGNDYTGLVERDSYRTAVTPVYGETIQTLDGVGHTALLRVKGSLTVKLNPQTAAQTAAICADLLNAPCEVQYRCLQRNVNVTALMVLDVVSAMFLSRCLYLGQKWNDVDEIVLKEL